MELIKQRFGEDFINSVNDFCKGITLSCDVFVKTIIQIGNSIDHLFGYESGFAVKSIIDVLNTNEKVRNLAQDVFALYGLEALKALLRNFFPAVERGSNVYVLVNYHNDVYIPDIIKPKPYKGHSDPKHKLPCKPTTGYKRTNQWKRTRSNPKLR